jgi:sugar phosphate isomerase/epimerase
MLVGAMNHPREDVVSEIGWMAKLGMDFVDLTLEPPAAATWAIDTAAIRRALESYKMQVVGHTAFYLPFANPFESVRRAAVTELKQCVDSFAAVGAKWMNLHPDRHTPMHDRTYYIRRNIESLKELQEYADKAGVGLMIENLPGDFNNALQLGELLEALPDLGLHLDIGHANLMVPRNTTGEILQAWGSRLRHVHLHDNRGGSADLHLPLGAGDLNLRWALAELIKVGFDGTVTLEVFTPDRHFLTYSRDVLKQTWAELHASERPEKGELVSSR